MRALWSSAVVTGCSASDLFAINGAAGNDLWAIGTNATIARWNGASWVTGTQGNADFWDLWVESPTDVYRVGTIRNIERAPGGPLIAVGDGGLLLVHP